jgi:2,4-dienoyl-CoA reductase-like NADH-dependent reductase (Old Yellow Enzyme family)
MSKNQFEHLFAPLQVGPMRVPNRICETTNTINSSPRPGAVPAGLAAKPGCSTFRFHRKRRMK